MVEAAPEAFPTMAALGFASERVSTYGETMKDLPMFTHWELYFKNRSKVTPAQRKELFTAWCTDMIMTHQELGPDEAKAYVKHLITDNGIGCCHDYVVAVKDGPRGWTSKPLTKHHGAVDMLHRLTKFELKLVEDGSASAAQVSTLSGEDQLHPNVMMAQLITAALPGADPAKFKSVPGLDKAHAAQRLAKQLKLEQRLEATRSYQLKGLASEATPRYSLFTQYDMYKDSGQKHPPWNLLKDSQLWFLTKDGEKEKELNPENVGFPAQFLIMHQFLLMLLCVEEIDIVELLNAEHYQARLVSSHGRDIAMHWFQELLDELNRKSQGKRDLGKLHTFLTAEMNSEIHKTVMATLERRFPRKVAQPKGDAQKEKELKSQMDALKQKVSGLQSQVAKGKGKSKGDWGRRERSRGRSRSRRQRTPPRRRPSPTNATSTQKKQGSNDPVLNKAFQIARDKKNHCPWHQKGECSFGGKCSKDHKCIICSSERHGAYQCQDLKTAKGKKALGL